MKAPKTAAILIIGDEILSGRTLDTNTQTIALMLGEKGIAIAQVRIVPDVVETVAAHVNELRKQVDYLFTTGGIGPTHDDKTAESIARAFGVTLERHPEAWARLVKHYQGEENINPGRARMAMIPAGATLIDNPVSSAPGFKIGNVHVLAGVPKIMEGMMEGILPGLAGGAVIHSKSVAADLAESELAPGLEFIEQSYPGISVGSYPKFTPGSKPATVIVIRGVDLDAVAAAQIAVFNLMVNVGGIPVLS